MIPLLKEASEGTDLYYATLYFPKSVREVLCAIEVTRRAITNIPQKINDDEVARLKLSWWWDEVARFKAGKSRHPLLELIKAERANPRELGEKLHHLIENVMGQMHTSSFTKKTNSLERIKSLNEAVFEHIIKACGQETDDDCVLVLELACLNELANQILSSAPHIEPAQSGMPSNAVTSDGAQSSKEVCVVHPSDRIGIICQNLSSALSKCPRNLQRRQRFFSTLAHINELVLKLTLKRKPYEAKRIELLPVKKLWVSWRTKSFL